MANLTEQMKTTWDKLPARSRWTIGGVSVAVVLGLAATVALQSGTKWVTVARIGVAEDRNAALETLKSKKIPVRLAEGSQDTIEVPTDKLDEARMEVASIASQGRMQGVDLFEKPSFGITSGMEKAKLRAIRESELARTLRALEGVQDASVKLAMPERVYVFQKDNRPITAAVTLSLSRGTELAKSQVDAIRYLVSSSVEGLKPGAVTIVDNHRNLLAAPSDDGGLLVNDDEARKEAMRHEADLERRLLELLTPLVGEGRVRVQASVLMESRRIETKETEVDPEKQAPKSEFHKEQSKSSAEAPAKGAVGSAANVGEASKPSAAPQVAATTTREDKFEYIHSTVQRHVVDPGRGVKRLSLAVLVDGKAEKGQDGAETWAPLAPETLKQIEGLAASAAGIDRARGDQVSVVCQQFVPFEDTAAITAPPAAMKPWMKELAPWAALLLVVLLLVVFVLRPMITAPHREAAAAPLVPATAVEGATVAGTPLVGTVEPLTALGEGVAASAPELALPPPPSFEELRRRAQELVQSDPKRSVQIVRAWLVEEA